MCLGRTAGCLMLLVNIYCTSSSSTSLQSIEVWSLDDWKDMKLAWLL